MKDTTESSGLPPLSERRDLLGAFNPSGNQAGQLRALLKDVCRKEQGDEDRAFYPIRETAAAFGVSYRTVARVYDYLDAEGLLQKTQGTQTVLTGRNRRPKHPVKGVVVFPVPIEAFVLGPSWRVFYSSLESHLRKQGYIVNVLLFREQEGEPSCLAARILDHVPDLVLFWTPPLSIRPILDHLDGRGIPTMLVGMDHEFVRRRRFLFRAEPAWEEALLHRWPREVEGYDIVDGDNSLARREHGCVKGLLEKHAIPYTEHWVSARQEREVLVKLGAMNNRGVIFPFHRWYDPLCMRNPHEAAELLARGPVLMMQEPVYQPYFQERDLTVDTFVMDYAAAAEQVARAICRNEPDGSRKAESAFAIQFVPDYPLRSVQRDF